MYNFVLLYYFFGQKQSSVGREDIFIIWFHNKVFFKYIVALTLTVTRVFLCATVFSTLFFILRHFLYLLYLCPCLDLVLFNVVSMWSIFYFHLQFHYDWSYQYRHTCCFVSFSEYILLFLDDNVDEECE